MLTVISYEIEEQVRIINGAFADVSTLAFVPAHTFITEASHIVGGFVHRVGATLSVSWDPLECLWGWEAGKKGWSEHVMEVASCSIVRRWSDA